MSSLELLLSSNIHSENNVDSKVCSAHSSCCAFLEYTPHEGADVYIVNLVLCGITLVTMIYLFVRLVYGYASKKSELLSAYLSFTIVLLLWLLLTALSLVLPKKLFITTLLDRLRFVGDMFLDNFLVFYTMLAPSDQTALKAILLTLLVTSVHVGLLFSFNFDGQCAGCAMIFPAAEVLYSDIFSTILFLLILILSHFTDKFKLRSSGKEWAQFMLAFEAIFLVCTIVISRPSDAGYCLLTGAVGAFRIVYVPFLYYLLAKDSNEVVSKKILGGDVDHNSDPLLYYRNQLSNMENSVKIIDFEDLTFGPKIGVGGYGEVYRGRWKHTDVGIKRVFKNEQSEGNVDNFMKEIAILSKLHHPNIMLFIGACVAPTGVYIITEYMSQGSAYAKIHKNPGPLAQTKGKRTTLSVLEKLNLLLDAARGMVYLHSFDPPIIHRDLKSQNLLLDKYGRGKLCDFGLSREMTSETMSRLGTIQYSAPETLRGERYGPEVDIYSFAILMWEIMTEEVPYEGQAPIKSVIFFFFL
eukprot:TRINITY_DN6833_c0_g1_i1.p1 TRINITY_DN6833_c0_g1~~TRINITY_DN6833_c0_g1_i1.p1  ORF type:complete len:525 (+),score=61.05 TRINITY_DN6833_c0_g1_i1:26-1600(+)